MTNSIKKGAAGLVDSSLIKRLRSGDYYDVDVKDAADAIEQQAAEMLNMGFRADRQASTIASLYQAKASLEREVSRLTSQIASPSAERDEINQCDGCRVQARLTVYGHHAMPGGGFMGCSKHLYRSGQLDDAQREQIGTSEEADFERNTWTFRMRPGFVVTAGEYLIAPRNPQAGVHDGS